MSWYSIQNWKQAITTLFFTISPIYAYLYFGDIELTLANVTQLGIAVLLGSLWFLLISFISFVSANIRLYQNNREIIQKYQPRNANFRFEADRDVYTGVIGVRIFNDEIVDFTERTGELLGFAPEIKNEYTNMIGILPPESRRLQWKESGEKIEAGGHGYAEVAMIDWEGVHFDSMFTEHNTDKATWKVAIEINGKLDGRSINKKKYCITFNFHKSVGDNREIWLTGLPKIEEGDCAWVKTISLSEAIRMKEEKKKKNDKENQ